MFKTRNGLSFEISLDPFAMRATHGRLMAKLVCTSYVRKATRLSSGEAASRWQYPETIRRSDATRCRRYGKGVTWHASWGSLERFHNRHYANLNPILTHVSL